MAGGEHALTSSVFVSDQPCERPTTENGSQCVGSSECSRLTELMPSSAATESIMAPHRAAPSAQSGQCSPLNSECAVTAQLREQTSASPEEARLELRGLTWLEDDGGISEAAAHVACRSAPVAGALPRQRVSRRERAAGCPSWRPTRAGINP